MPSLVLIIFCGSIVLDMKPSTSSARQVLHLRALHISQSSVFDGDKIGRGPDVVLSTAPPADGRTGPLMGKSLVG